MTQAFDDADEPVDPGTEAALRVMLGDLGWWSAVLDRARAEGELRPGASRFAKELRALSP